MVRSVGKGIQVGREVTPHTFEISCSNLGSVERKLLVRVHGHEDVAHIRLVR